MIMSPMFLLFQSALGTCGCSADTVQLRDAWVSTNAFEVRVFPWIINSVEVMENFTVFFSDIVRFAGISQALSPVKVCTMLDALTNKHEVFKVETIGDAWVGVTNRTCFLTKRASPLCCVCIH
jgi:hypothetical protein